MTTWNDGSGLSTDELAAYNALVAAGLPAAITTLQNAFRTARTACAATCPDAPTFRAVLLRYMADAGTPLLR